MGDRNIRTLKPAASTLRLIILDIGLLLILHGLGYVVISFLLPTP
jgi:hypothetical protein